MGSWNTRDEALAAIEQGYYIAYLQTGHIDDDITLAHWWYDNGFDHPAIGYTIDAVEHCYSALLNLVQQWPIYDPKYAIPYFLKNYTAELSWQTICEAWVANDFEGRNWTIGIIDKMRQILWDEPFDLRWAARPITPQT